MLRPEDMAQCCAHMKGCEIDQKNCSENQIVNKKLETRRRRIE